MGIDSGGNTSASSLRIRKTCLPGTVTMMIFKIRASSKSVLWHEFWIGASPWKFDGVMKIDPHEQDGGKRINASR